MTTTPVELAPEAHEPRYAPVASYVHTAFLVVLIFAMSWFSANAPQRLAGRHDRSATYASMFASEWLLFGYVYWGLRSKGVRIREIINARWHSPEVVLLDLALAAGFWIAAAMVLVGLAYLLGF